MSPREHTRAERLAFKNSRASQGQHIDGHESVNLFITVCSMHDHDEENGTEFICTQR